MCRVAELAARQAVAHRRALHAIPEAGLDLPDTVAYIRAALQAAGLQPRDCGHGLIADVGAKGPLIAIRADMDGLPMAEATGLAFASRRPGFMHACGHDAHSGALLAVAEQFASRPPEGYRLRFIFQAGEEGFFGARHMIDNGCLDGLSAIVGAHVGDLSEELGPGQAGFMAGPMMAASDRFEASFTGSGGHGSAPHQTVDPIPALAQFVMAAQVIRSRQPDQRHPLVLSICQVAGGSAFNIIPDRASCLGTARTFAAADQALLRHSLEKAGHGLAAAYGLTFQLNWMDGYPALVNDAAATGQVRAAVEAAFGPGGTRLMTAPSMGGEDFAYYLQQVPGCFWFLNTQNPAAGIVHPNHHSHFTVDEALLPRLMLGNLAGAAALAAAAIRG
ncbi:MAG: hypothetical protein A2087_02900 [Spirochaetes bacterium GWD1_61_31]|nr:MAG: hypothetical protein A2Y37_03795 [Spirochaetes bacterium GWB1_60_80]OHD28604.1 MAG: hypothetical protein A2004_06060 [Spirochaetes bacterium GWC1_61_12]OHD37614.1 MAG: hypothetical protein A2087_02900 [Spirochaetes bacterium GWD1_61_31]OHD61042.1 MAG: hypothetical protein A2Y32_05060 [Spirochaetes bacterium GWF1_60_12]